MMKIMKKFQSLAVLFMAVILAFGSIFSFAGCETTPTNSTGSGGGSTAAKYTVTFIYNDNATANKSVRVEEGKKVEEPTDPVRDGYVFSGWFTNAGLTTEYNFESSVTKNVSLYAKWDQELTVTFVYNDDVTDNSFVTIGAGAQVEKPIDPTRVDYTFSGWFTDEELKTAYDFTSSVAGNVTLYAKWTPVVSTVTFVYNDDATANSTTTVTTGEKLAKPADPTRSGYDFAGWYSDEELTVEYIFNSVVSDNMTLYASWMESGVTYYTVTMHYNDDAETTSTVRVKENGRMQVPADPERANYIFMGWYTDAEGSNKFVFSTRITTDTNLYVKWGTPYVFEAEDTNISGIVGKGYSGTATGSDIIGRGAGASNGYYITYLYDFGITLEFQIVSDKAVSDAILHLSLSAEMANFDIDGDMYQVLVNDTPMNYNISFNDIDTAQNAEKKPFEYYEIATAVSLKAGVNVIKLVTNNTRPLMGTMNSTAPMVDSVKLITDAVLGWNKNAGYPYDNTSALS